MKDSSQVGVNWGVTRRHLLGDPIPPKTERWGAWDEHYPQCTTSLVVYPIISDEAPKHIRGQRLTQGFDDVPWCKRCAKRAEAGA